MTQHGLVCAGCPAAAGAAVRCSSSSEVTLETFKASGGKRTVKQRLSNATATMVLIQEFRRVAEHVEALRSWCAGRLPPGQQGGDSIP